MAFHQLLVADAALRGRDGRWQIGIDDGRITPVTRGTPTGGEEIDAALPAYTSDDMGSALHSIELASAVEADCDRTWIEPDARDDAPAHVVASDRLVASSTQTMTYHLPHLEGIKP